MTLQTILNTLRLILKDNSKISTLSLEEFNALLDAVNNDMFWSRYNINVNKQGDLRDNISNDLDLIKFKTSTSLTLTSGQVSLPNDYVLFLGAYDTYTLRNIDEISEIELTNRMQNKSSKRLSVFPAAIINENKIKVYPTNISNIKLFYLRKPTTPVYVTTYSQTKFINEYSSESSTQIEWPEYLHPEFIKNMLNYLGIQISLDNVKSYMK